MLYQHGTFFDIHEISPREAKGQHYNPFKYEAKVLVALSDLELNLREMKLNNLKTDDYISLHERNFHVGQGKHYQSNIIHIA